MLLPAFVTARIAVVIAAIPDEKSAADSPFSITAIFSSTSCTVGLGSVNKHIQMDLPSRI